MHTYGFTHAEMSKLAEPSFEQRSWGSISSLSNSFYHMEHIIVKAKHSTGLFSRSQEGTYYLSTGTATALLVSHDGRKISAPFHSGETFSVHAGDVHGFFAGEECSIYFFGPAGEGRIFLSEQSPDPHAFHPEKLPIGKTTDFREKYWGSIETIVSKDYCGKRIAMRPSTQNSLEIHCRKHETYWVEKGEVIVGIRVGRAENKSVALKKGDVFSIPPGLMHMKIAKADCIVMEISTEDDDSDSHIVEDGMKYIHKED